MSTHYTGWNKHLLVTLTATSNRYLANQLPLRGLLRIVEMRTDGYAQPTKATFLKIDDDGNPVGTEVAVDDAAFNYTPPGPEDSGSRARS